MSVYGLCPMCRDYVTIRERRPDGNDTCRNGHTFPSKKTIDNSDVYNEPRHTNRSRDDDSDDDDGDD